METLQIGSVEHQVPTTWNELTRRQLLRLLPALYAAPTPDQRHRLLAILTGFPLPTLTSLPPSVLAQLLPLTDWLSSERHLLTAQLLPTLPVAGRHVTERATRWVGPRESFRNLLFGEFIFADTFFVLYALHQRPEHLARFLAVLYRPARSNADPEAPDWNGDLRQPFNEHHLEARAPRLASVPPVQQLAVLTWYRGCRQQLAREFPDVFVAAEHDAGSQANQAPDWGRVLRKLAGGAFGSVEQTARQPVRSLLAEMQDIAQEVNRLKTRTPHA